ncbi:methyl-accepting chemotaxis protein [Pseudoduganella sp. GCM10020061]|uniref:methyl-accepting chemotaxis protein n=1 Tax=Pseudoduganella sp. GCM10020061 TaxID=3317345 RepID=UPI00362B9394
MKSQTAFQLHNFKIRTRLGVSYGLVLTLMSALIVVALTLFASIETSTVKLVEKDWAKADAASTINARTRDQARRNMELFLAPDQAYRAKVHEHIESNKKIITEAIETLDSLLYLPEGKAIMATIKAERVRYVASFTQVGQLIEDGNVEEARRTMMEETLPILDRLQLAVNNMTDLQKRLATQSADHVKAEVAFGSRLMIALGIGALLVAVIFAYVIARSITRPINRAVGVAKTVAAGDLTCVIDSTATDETGQLLRALKDMNDSLAVVVSEVRSGTDLVSTASAQIAAGTLDLSARTEEQASSLEETAASMEELTATVRQNADNALQANQLASSASQVAVRGGAVMAEVVQTMDSINESSKKIADIISVIDGIAFQTNILALNAAVEAARAGEQGRGFAVVASEVRMLAQRSAAAAKEIKSLIGASVDKVDAGCRLVEQAGSTMDEIVVSVRRVTDIMGEIAGASDEQTAGIGQINQAICQMDQVTQQNAALVEESASAAASLEAKAASLARTVAVFKVDESVLLRGESEPLKPVAAIAVLPQKPAVPGPAPQSRQPAQYKRLANARPGSVQEWEEY